MTALGLLVVRRRRLVLVAWLLLVAVGFGGGSAVFGRMGNVGGSADAESVRGWQLLSDASTTGPRILAVVDGARVDDPQVRAEVTAATDELQALEGVARATDPYDLPGPLLVAEDGEALVVAVDLERFSEDVEREQTLEAVEQRLRQIDVGEVAVGGDLLLNEEINEAVEQDLQRGELISLPVALVVLVVVFGGVLAAGLPLVGAVSTIAGALLVLLGASYLLDLSPDVVSVVTVLGLGLAIDYGLLIVSRFREERTAGLDVHPAVVRTCETAGRTVAFSGVTVAVSLSALLVLEDPTFRAMGAAGISVVLVAVAAALTLTPALLAVLGGRLKVPAARVQDDGAFARLARRVQRRPLLVAASTAALLVAFALPFLGVRFVDGGPELIPRSFETRQVADTLSARFAGQEAEPVEVITVLPVDDPALQAWVERVEQRPEVLSVTPEAGDGGLTVVDVVPSGADQDDAALDLVRALREDRPSKDALVTGSAAFLVDLNASLAERLPWALLLIAVATFVLLFLMTGSVLVPAKALVMNVLSLGASFGALVLVFQEGWLAGPLGVEPAAGLQTWVPVLVFVFAFGLSMDYEVFLLSRIKELVDEGYDNDTAVALGLQRSGRIITCAALLLIIVFAGFAAGQMAAITQLGLAMAVAIAVDATLVRCLLVPATMTLLGRANWWAPAPLRRLHDHIGLSEGGRAPLPASPVPSDDVRQPAALPG